VFNVRVEGGGKRLLVDISNADVVAGVKEALTSQVGLVGGVLTQGFKTDAGSMTRLSVSLLKASHLPRSCRGHDAEGVAVASAVTAAASAADVKAPGRRARGRHGRRRARRRFRFEKGKAGADRVLINATAVAAFIQLGTTPGGRVRLRAEEDAAPEAIAKTIWTLRVTQHSPLIVGQRLLRALQ